MTPTHHRFTIVMLISIGVITGYCKVNTHENSSLLRENLTISGIQVKGLQSEEWMSLDSAQCDTLIHGLASVYRDGPVKFMKTHVLLIHYKTSTDTIYTNGSTFQLKTKWFTSSKNLLHLW